VATDLLARDKRQQLQVRAVGGGSKHCVCPARHGAVACVLHAMSRHMSVQPCMHGHVPCPR
jgi:hypothetical protein